MIGKVIKFLFSNNIEIGEFDTEDARNLGQKLSEKYISAEISKIQKSIEHLEAEKKHIQDTGAVSHNFVSFSILVLITIGLTLYLFVFYSSTVYSSFYGNVTSSTGGFIRASVFTEAAEKGTGATAIIILAPFIFIGLGFLIHNALKENRARLARRQNKKWGFISLLVALTFLFDALMAYKISEGIHNDIYLRGLTDIQWKSDLVFSDINFWLVLFSGFVVYVIWGLLLDKVMLDYENSQPHEALKKIDLELRADKVRLEELK